MHSSFPVSLTDGALEQRKLTALLFTAVPFGGLTVYFKPRLDTGHGSAVAATVCGDVKCDRYALVHAPDQALQQEGGKPPAAVALHFAHYNLVRDHKTLLVSP